MELSGIERETNLNDPTLKETLDSIIFPRLTPDKTQIIKDKIDTNESLSSVLFESGFMFPFRPELLKYLLSHPEFVTMIPKLHAHIVYYSLVSWLQIFGDSNNSEFSLIFLNMFLQRAALESLQFINCCAFFNIFLFTLSCSDLSNDILQEMNTILSQFLTSSEPPAFMYTLVPRSFDKLIEYHNSQNSIAYITSIIKLKAQRKEFADDVFMEATGPINELLDNFQKDVVEVWCNSAPEFTPTIILSSITHLLFGIIKLTQKQGKFIDYQTNVDKIIELTKEHTFELIPDIIRDPLLPVLKGFTSPFSFPASKNISEFIPKEISTHMDCVIKLCKASPMVREMIMNSMPQVIQSIEQEENWIELYAVFLFLFRRVQSMKDFIMPLEPMESNKIWNPQIIISTSNCPLLALNVIRNISIEMIMTRGIKNIREIIEKYRNFPQLEEEIIYRIMVLVPKLNFNVTIVDEFSSDIMYLTYYYQTYPDLTEEQKKYIVSARMSLFIMLEIFFKKENQIYAFFENENFAEPFLLLLYEPKVDDYVLGKIKISFKSKKFPDELPYFKSKLVSVFGTIFGALNVENYMPIALKFIKLANNLNVAIPELVPELASGFLLLPKSPESTNFFLEALDFLIKSSTEENFTPATLAAVEESISNLFDEPTQDLFVRLVQLLAGQPLESAQPTFIVRHPKIFKLIVGVFKDTQLLLTVFEFIAKLCEYSAVNCAAAATGGLSEFLIELMGEWRNDENVNSRLYASCMSLMMLIVTVSCSVNEARQFISLLCPIDGRTIPQTQNLIMKVLNKMIMDGLTRVMDALPLVPNGYFKTYAVIPKNFVIAFWIYSPLNDIKEYSNIATFSKLNISINNSAMMINDKEIKLTIDQKLWNLISINVTQDKDSSTFNVKCNNNDVIEYKTALIPLSEDQTEIVIGGGGNPEYYALIGSFGIFTEKIDIKKLMETSLRGTFDCPECVVYMQPWETDGSIYIQSNNYVEQGKIECSPFTSFADVLADKCGIEMLLPLFAQWDLPMASGNPNNIRDQTIDILINCLKLSADSQKQFAEVGGFKILSHLIISSDTKNIDLRLYSGMYTMLTVMEDRDAIQNILSHIIFNIDIWMRTTANDHLMIVKHWSRVVMKNYYNDTVKLLSFGHWLSMLITWYWYSKEDSMLHLHTERCRDEELNITECRKYLFEILKQIAQSNFDENNLRSLVSQILTCGEFNQCQDLIAFLQFLISDPKVMDKIEEPGKYISLLVYLFNLKSDDIVVATLSCIVHAFRRDRMKPITMKDQVDIMLHQVGSYFSRTSLVDRFIGILNENNPELLPLLAWMTLNNGRPIILPTILKPSRALVMNEQWAVWPMISAYKCQEESSRHDMIKYLLDCNFHLVLANIMTAANVIGLSLREDRNKMMHDILLLAADNPTYDEDFVNLAGFYMLYHDSSLYKSRLDELFKDSPYGEGDSPVVMNAGDPETLLAFDNTNMLVMETQKDKDIKRHSLNVSNLARNYGNMSSYNPEAAENTLSYLFPVHDQSEDTGKARRISSLSVSSYSSSSRPESRRRKNQSPKKVRTIIMPSELDKKIIDCSSHDFTIQFGITWGEDGKWADMDIAEKYIEKYVKLNLEITPEAETIAAYYVKFGGELKTDKFDNSLMVKKVRNQIEPLQAQELATFNEELSKGYNLTYALAPIRYMSHIVKMNKKNSDTNFQNLEQASSLASVAANEIADFEDGINGAKTHAAHLWSHLWQCMTFNHAPWAKSLPLNHSTVHYKRDPCYCGLIPLKMKKNKSFNDHKHESLVRDTGDEITAEKKLEEYKNELSKQYQIHAPSSLLDVIIDENDESNDSINIVDQRCLVELPCELIEIERKRSGTFSILMDSVVISLKDKTRMISLDMIQDVLLKTYLHHPTAIELVLIDGKNYFINFENVDSLTVLKHFKEIWLPNIMHLQMTGFQEYFEYLQLTEKWVSRQISNFEYLLSVNIYSGRTFNCGSQYPIMPWILADYSSTVIDLADPASYRDLTKPIGAVDPARLEGLVEKLDSFKQMGMKPYLYSSGPICPLSTYLWLVRMEPFTSLHTDIQGGKFDNPARLFSSIPNAWNLATKTQNDFRELIPEFFATPEFLINSNHFDLGTFMDAPVNDVALPAWANSPYDFVYIMRKALESDYVSSHLNHWIDLIWGVNQRSEEHNNVYMEEMYSSIWNDSNNLEDAERRAGIEAILMHVGQMPQQIFTKPHPQRYAHVLNTPLLAKNCLVDMFIDKVISASITKNGTDYDIALLSSEGKICERSFDLTAVAKAFNGSNLELRSKSNLSSSNFQISIGSSPHVKRGERRSNVDKTFSEPIDVTVESITNDITKIEHFNQLCSHDFAVPIAGGSFAVSGKLSNELYVASPNGACNKAMNQRSRIVCCAFDKKHIAVANSEAVISFYRKTFEKPTFKVPSFTSAIRCLCISEKFHMAVCGTKDTSLLFINIGSGHISKVVDLEGNRAMSVLITPSWGFVLVHAAKIVNGVLQHMLYLLSPNGDIITKKLIDFSIVVWTAESTASGFDIVAMVDDTGHFYVFEAFYLDIERRVYATNNKIVSIKIDTEENVVLAMTETGKLLLISVSIDI